MARHTPELFVTLQAVVGVFHMVLAAFGSLLWQLLGFGTLLLTIAIVVLIALGVLLLLTLPPDPLHSSVMIL